MCDVEIVIGDERFHARTRDELAPRSCALFQSLLPWRERIIHARWSGEACWIPLGDDVRFDAGFESATSHPAPGEIILYPGGKSETEILLAYGTVHFGSKAGQLCGNPILTITDDLSRLAEVCRDILWSGAREISFRLQSVVREVEPCRGEWHVSSEDSGRTQ